MSTTKVANISNLAGSKTITTDDLIDRATCRAWVNFNGTGTVAIRESFNVSSVTDNNTGQYTINFATAMPDANYCVAQAISNNNGTYNESQEAQWAKITDMTVNGFKVWTHFHIANIAYIPQDKNLVMLAVFR